MTLNSDLATERVVGVENTAIPRHGLTVGDRYAQHASAGCWQRRKAVEASDGRHARLTRSVTQSDDTAARGARP